MSNERFVDVYADHGCDVAPSCLSCPLDECKYVEPRSRTKHKDDLILADLDAGMAIEDVAKKHDTSERSVYRATERRRERTGEYVKRRRGSSNIPPEPPPRPQYEERFYMKACVRCGGDVRLNGRDLICMQCGFNYAGAQVRHAEAVNA